MYQSAASAVTIMSAMVPTAREIQRPRDGLRGTGACTVGFAEAGEDLADVRFMRGDVEMGETLTDSGWLARESCLAREFLTFPPKTLHSCIAFQDWPPPSHQH